MVDCEGAEFHSSLRVYCWIKDASHSEGLFPFRTRPALPTMGGARVVAGPRLAEVHPELRSPKNNVRFFYVQKWCEEMNWGKVAYVENKPHVFDEFRTTIGIDCVVASVGGIADGVSL